MIWACHQSPRKSLITCLFLSGLLGCKLYDVLAFLCFVHQNVSFPVPVLSKCATSKHLQNECMNSSISTLCSLFSSLAPSLTPYLFVAVVVPTTIYSPLLAPPQALSNLKTNRTPQAVPQLTILLKESSL